ncbi:MAG: fumarylacetoacetase [Acidimicrobiales bacterium]
MSWVPVQPESDFPIENLPFGVVEFPDRRVGVVVRIGDFVLDLAQAGIEPHLCASDSINLLLASGKGAEVRRRATDFLSGAEQGSVYPLDAITWRLPIAVGDFVDFYSSLRHATNLGRLLRPDGDPLSPNWRQLPVGYHGRAGSVVVSGTPVARPRGLVAHGAEPARLTRTHALDFELEVGFVIGAPGTQIAPDDCARHVFGAVLLNDWSARDIQAFENQPLGPNLSKSFATTISPWVVTLDALTPFLVGAPVQDPLPDPYLRARRDWALDISLEVDLNGAPLTRTNFSSMYWTFAQQLAHMTVNGARVRPGDLFGSGTVSGTTPGEEGSLMELSRNGAAPIVLNDGSHRAFLEDGDEVTMRGTCRSDLGYRIGFGSCRGRIAATSPGGI